MDNSARAFVVEILVICKDELQVIAMHEPEQSSAVRALHELFQAEITRFQPRAIPYLDPITRNLVSSISEILT